MDDRNQSRSNGSYQIKVEGATRDLFDIGGYGLAITFDETNTISNSALQSVLTGPYQNLNPSDINAIFLNSDGVLFNNKGGDGSTTQLIPPGIAVPILSYSRMGESNSDLIGAVVGDPTTQPVYTSPTTPGTYRYPDGTTTSSYRVASTAS